MVMASAQLDPTYFSTDPWKKRVADWLVGQPADGFLEGNALLVRQIMEHEESGLRMVVNISAHALLTFLAERRYKNIYEQPIIGGERRTPSPERIEVDTLLGFGANASQYYFGAVALGGTGVRFYGEYCMALRPDAVEASTQIFDRDSYDLLLPPLSHQPAAVPIARMLAGRWDRDVIDMLTLKLLPELKGTNRLVTTGTVSEMILHDQEFVEIYRQGAIVPGDVQEVRQSPDEVVMEARIHARRQTGIPPSAVELVWLDRRERVAAALEDEGIHYRIVTLHGRGYQWK
jgi:hypothetical protein